MFKLAFKAAKSGVGQDTTRLKGKLTKIRFNDHY